MKENESRALLFCKYTTTPPNRNLLHCSRLRSRTAYLSLLHPLRPLFFLYCISEFFGSSGSPRSRSRRPPLPPPILPGFLVQPGTQAGRQPRLAKRIAVLRPGKGVGGTRRSAAVGSRPIEPTAGRRIARTKGGQGSNQRCSQRHLLTHG